MSKAFLLQIFFFIIFSSRVISYYHGHTVYLTVRSKLLMNFEDEPENKKVMPKPTIITPSDSARTTSIEKFLMMYTCKKCNYRNAQMVAKVAYNYGMVISTCKQCKIKHLIADNKGKLDMAEYGKKIEDYLVAQGEVVKKLTLKPSDIENNYLIDRDGELELFPKIAGQPPSDARIIDMPSPPKKGFGQQ